MAPIKSTLFKAILKQVLQSGVQFASDDLSGKNAKQVGINQTKTAGLNLLQKAKQKLGKQKAPPRKVQNMKCKKHYNIFT